MQVPVAQMRRLSRLPATEPFWSKEARYRFDDAHPLADQRFGVLYCAGDLATAFAESTIHDNACFRHGAFEVSAAELAARRLVLFTHPMRGELTLADLTGEALKALGLNNDLSAGDTYEVCQQWSHAVHEALPALDGIRYLSRQHNAGYCYAVFERSGVLRESVGALTEEDRKALCRQFNVRVTVDNEDQAR